MDESKIVEVNGRHYFIQYEYSANKLARAYIRQDKLLIKIPRRWPNREQVRAAEALERRLLRRLSHPETRLNPVPQMSYEEKRAFIARSLPSLTARVHELNNVYFNSPLGTVRIKSNLSNWGSCSRDNNISINITLLFLPEPLLDYVIVHELAHTKVRNHSRQFWKLVEAILPDYMQRKKELRRYLLAT